MLLIFAYILVSILGMSLIFISMIGERDVINETIRLAPGDQKSYYLPPGYNTIYVTSSIPVEENEHSLFSQGYASGIGSGGYEGIGTPVINNCTLKNTRNNETNVTMHVTTGILNPFGYIPESIWRYVGRIVT
jgi:hypothetical protein